MNRTVKDDLDLSAPFTSTINVKPMGHLGVRLAFGETIVLPENQKVERWHTAIMIPFDLIVPMVKLLEETKLKIMTANQNETKQ